MPNELRGRGADNHHWVLAVVTVLAVLVVFQLISLYGSSSGKTSTPSRTFGKILGEATSTSQAAVTNSAPTVGSVTLNAAGSIALGANQTTAIIGNATITDNNGCEDITYIQGILFHTNVSYSSANNNATRYNVSCAAESGTCTGGEDVTSKYVCTFQMKHFAQPTDGSSNYSTDVWNMTITAIDIPGDTFGFGSTTQELDTLTGFTLYNGSLDFGTLALGANSSSDIRGATANTGNQQIDMQLDGYARTDGDGRAMNCTVGNITVGKIKYNNASFTFYEGSNNTVNGTALNDTASELDLELERGSDADNTPLKNVFFRMGLPAIGVGGSCTGTIVFTAVGDATGD